MQPYDLKVLIEKEKAEGLNAIEDKVKASVKNFFEWLEESARASATPFDDIVLVVTPKLKQMILDAADKIDGQPG